MACVDRARSRRRSARTSWASSRARGSSCSAARQSTFPRRQQRLLPGVAVALGFSASIIWGSEAIGIYLEVVVGAYLGVSFSPTLFIAGQIHLSRPAAAADRLIGASGDFLITAPTPFYLDVQVCGSVSFFFFSISACVRVLHRQPVRRRRHRRLTHRADVPAELRAGDPLRTRRRATHRREPGRRHETSTQACLRRSAGEAAASRTAAVQQPVPIDTVPVLQFDVRSRRFGDRASTFTEPVPQCPMLPTGLGGKSVSLGGGRTAVYQLTVDLADQPAAARRRPDAASVWRKNTPSNDTTATRVDLALFSRDPNIASHALERSTTLNEQLTARSGVASAPRRAAGLRALDLLRPAGSAHRTTAGISPVSHAGSARHDSDHAGSDGDARDGPDSGQCRAALLGTFGPLLGLSALPAGAGHRHRRGAVASERSHPLPARRSELPELRRAAPR